MRLIENEGTIILQCNYNINDTACTYRLFVVGVLNRFGDPMPNGCRGPAAEDGDHASPCRWLIASCRQRNWLHRHEQRGGHADPATPGTCRTDGAGGGNCCPHLKGMRNALVADLRRLGRRRQRKLLAGMEKRSYGRLGRLTCWLRRRRHHISMDLAGIMPDRSKEPPLCTGRALLSPLRTGLSSTDPALQNRTYNDTLEER